MKQIIENRDKAHIKFYLEFESYLVELPEQKFSKSNVPKKKQLEILGVGTHTFNFYSFIKDLSNHLYVEPVGIQTRFLSSQKLIVQREYGQEIDHSNSVMLLNCHHRDSPHLSWKISEIRPRKDEN